MKFIAAALLSALMSVGHVAHAASERPQGRATPSPPPVGVKETWGGPEFP